MESRLVTPAPDPDSLLAVQHERTADLATVRIVGELDLSTVDRLRAALTELPGDAREVHLDLSDLAFADSTGLKELLVFGRRVQDEDAVLRTVAVSEPVGALLRMTAIGLSLGWDG